MTQSRTQSAVHENLDKREIDTHFTCSIVWVLIDFPCVKSANLLSLKVVSRRDRTLILCLPCLSVALRCKQGLLTTLNAFKKLNKHTKVSVKSTQRKNVNRAWKQDCNQSKERHFAHQIKLQWGEVRLVAYVEALSTCLLASRWRCAASVFLFITKMTNFDDDGKTDNVNVFEFNSLGKNNIWDAKGGSLQFSWNSYLRKKRPGVFRLPCSILYPKC